MRLALVKAGVGSQSRPPAERNHRAFPAFIPVRSGSRGCGRLGIDEEAVVMMGEDGLKGSWDMISVLLLLALVVLAPVLFDMATALGS
jgi:hypothetical protein